MTTTIAAQAYTRKPELSNAEWYLGYRSCYLAEGKDTNGQFALVEMWGHQGCEPPPHVHTREDEFFYILEGELTIFAGPDTLEAGPGCFIYMPAGLPHTFKIHTPTGRALAGMTPAGFENFFHGMARPAENMGIAPMPTEVDVPKLIALAEDAGCQFLPPGTMPADITPAEGYRRAHMWKPGASQPMNVLGAQISTLVDSAQSNGILSVFYAEESPNPGPPLHIHRNEDEAFYILEGSIAVQIEDELINLSAGEFAYVPRGVRHSYRVQGGEPAKMLVFTTPAGFEKFFSAMSVLSNPAIYEVIATAGEHGVEIIGYPIGV